MALKNRKDIETNELKGVVLAVDESKIKPGVFVRLSNWKASGVNSIQKKRGVLALATEALAPPTPTEDCTFGSGATAPNAPSNLVATADPDILEIVLTWTDNSADETSFSLERCVGSGCTNFTPIIVLPADATTFTDTNVDELTTYAYRLRAVNNAGVSAYSNVAEATTVDIPDAPPGVDLALWLDASQIIDVNNGDPLDTWFDEAGMLNDFVATEAARPTYYDTGPLLINSLPVVRFDGIDDFMTCTGLDSTLWAGATMFIVGRLTADPPTVDPNRIGLWKFNSSDAPINFPGTDGIIRDATFTTVRKTVGNPTDLLDRPFVYSIASEAGAFSARLNRVELFSTAVNTFIGQNGGNLLGKDGTLFFDGVIGEIVLFEGVLTVSDRVAMETYLMLKWGLT
jgi:hypothetical protein